MFLETVSYDFQFSVWKEIALNAGKPRSVGELSDYIRSCSWDDFIDSIAYITNGISSVRAIERYDPHWLDFIRPAFEQEHITFLVDSQGSPQPVVDTVFSELVDSTLDSLDGPLFENATSRVLAALKYMKKSETLGDAIYNTFLGVENIFKMSSGKLRLDKKSAEEFYRTSWIGQFENPEKTAASQMIGSLGQWVDAAHNYRHADDQPKVTPPSRETAVWMISTGMAHIRWVAQVHRELIGKGEGA